ncbi:MAG: hypothetical protein GY827_02065 [Cytophagales bacterium]|nr:hypothetical protein [Cytophagales bacterium]
MRKTSLIVLLSIFLWGCGGEEIGRLPINKISREGNVTIKEVTLELKKDEELGLWSEMDMEYEEEASFRFQVIIMKDGKEYEKFQIDPTKKNVSLGESKITLNGKTSWEFTGRNTAYKVKEDGTYIFKSRLIASENPSIILNKAELVIKR